MPSAPHHPNAAELCVQAARWAAAGHPHNAAHLYAAALDIEPGDTRARLALADCWVRCNQPANAAEHYLRIAIDYTHARRIREAIAIGHQVLHLDPRQFVYVAVAEMLGQMGHHGRPLCARAAEAHLAQGRTVDGLDMLRLGTELDGRDPQAHRRLAQLFLSQHRVRDALVHLAQAGRLLLAAGNNGEYIQVAELLLHHDPSHLETLRQLPRVYLRVGEPQRAVARLSDLMRVSPGDTIGFEILAHAFATIGRTQTSLSILERLVTELSATQQRPVAEAIIDRATVWRLHDPDFGRAAVALLDARPAPAPMPAPVAAPVAARPTTSEGTVVLDISDLMPSEPEEILDVSDMVEIIGTQVIDISEIEVEEDTMVLQLSYRDVTALIHDDDSAELISAPPRPPRRRRPAPPLRPSARA